MLFSDVQPSASMVRHPICTVLVNKTALTGVVSVEVTSTANFSADTFEVICAVAELPAALGLNYWDRSVGDEITITFSVGGQTQDFTFYGQVDHVEYVPAARTLTLFGRDLSSIFIDTKVTKSFHDQKASEVIAKIAAGHTRDGTPAGKPILTTNIAATKKRVGSYNQINAKMLSHQSEWDVMVQLAQQEGYDLWVSGHTLNFQPLMLSTVDPYILLWSDLGQGNRVSNTKELQLSRSQTLANDVVVKVISFNQAQGRTFKASSTVAKSGNKRARSYEAVMAYPINVPNLTQEQANQLANAMAEEISRHERVIHATLPGDNMLAARHPIQLVGTGTSWDQLYYPDTIVRRISVSEGYSMDVRAKNHGATTATAST